MRFEKEVVVVTVDESHKEIPRAVVCCYHGLLVVEFKKATTIIKFSCWRGWYD